MSRLLALMLVFPLSSLATYFNVQVVDYGLFGPGQTFDDAGVRADIDTAVAEFTAGINQQFPQIDQSVFLRGMADTNAMATKVDNPLADFDYFSFGISGAVALSESITSSSLQLDQFEGAGASFMMNFGLTGSAVGLDSWLPKSLVFVNFLSVDQSFNEFSFATTHLGLRVAWPWIEGSGGLLRWSGVRLATGFEYSSSEVSFTETINETQPNNTLTVGSDTFNFDAVFNQEVSLGAKITTYSFPFEVTTGAEILHFFGLYTGLGVDLNFGTAETIITGGGPVNFEVTGVQSTTISAVGSADSSDSASPRFENMRFIFGGNLDFFLADLFLQYNKALLDSYFGFALGLRMSW